MKEIENYKGNEGGCEKLTYPRFANLYSSMDARSRFERIWAKSKSAQRRMGGFRDQVQRDKWGSDTFRIT